MAGALSRWFSPKERGFSQTAFAAGGATLGEGTANLVVMRPLLGRGLFPGVMVTIERKSDAPYVWTTGSAPLDNPTHPIDLVATLRPTAETGAKLPQRPPRRPSEVATNVPPCPACAQASCTRPSGAGAQATSV